MLRPGLISASVGLAASLFAAGCSGDSSPALPSLSQITGSANEAPAVGPPTEVYARVARGILACWFGRSGPLKAEYVYHAEAQPPAKGGKAEIVIHERDRTSNNPKGLRAYRVSIAPDGQSSSLKVENLNLPGPLAKSMEEDVRRWAAGGIGCADSKGKWTPSKPPDERKRKKSRRKKRRST